MVNNCKRIVYNNRLIRHKAKEAGRNAGGGQSACEKKSSRSFSRFVTIQKWTYWSLLATMNVCLSQNGGLLPRWCASII